MRKFKYILMVFLVALLFGGVYWAQPKPIRVSMVQVGKGVLEAKINNTRAGTVEACRRAKLSPMVGGKITALNVKEGQRVEAGSVLLTLWRDDLQAQQTLAQQQLLTTQNRVAEVCALSGVSQDEVKRAESLFAQGFISTEAVQRARAESDAKQASCKAVQSEMAQGRSRIEAANASLQRMVLTAPFSGVVADIRGELGEYTTPSPPGVQTPAVIDLIDDTCLYVRAPIDEVDASLLRLDQPARISLDAIKGQIFQGKVTRIAPYVLDLEKQARTVDVEVSFDQLPASQRLLIGYSADVEIIYQQKDDVVRIPSQAILEGGKVLVYGKEGLLESRQVELGLANWEWSEIRSGVETGDWLVNSFDMPEIKAGVKVLSPQENKAVAK